jgi:hypothetical protein
MKYGSIIVIQWGYNGDIMEHIARRCPKKAKSMTTYQELPTVKPCRKCGFNHLKWSNMVEGIIKIGTCRPC